MSADLAEALSHHQAGRHAEAELLYCRIIDTTPGEPTVLYLSGMLNYEMGHIARATERLEALVAVRPHHVKSLLALAKLRILANATEAAIAVFRRIIALEPDHCDAHLGLGEALLTLGRPGDALLALAAADPGSCDVWFARGNCLRALYRLPEAAEALRRAVAIDPRRASAHLALGRVCVELGQFEAAERHLGLAIAVAPCAEAHASLGSALLLAGRPDEAEACYRRALALDADLVAAHQNLAAILAARRNHRAARNHREQAYRRQNIFVEPSPAPVRTVLLLVTASGGNVPTQFLFPRASNTRVTWVAEYGGAESLPPYDLVFNAIGDPDMAGGAAAPLADFLRGCSCPLLNDPAQVARTCRHLLPDLLAGIADLVVPAVLRLAPGRSLADAAIELPVLLRPAGSHGGQEVTRVDSAEPLLIAGPEDCYVTRFHDFRSADGQYRKYRVIFVDREPYACHLAIGAHWLLHYVTADMLSDPAKCAEEQRFLADPEAVLGRPAMAAIRAVGQRLALDFCGADFTVLPDGRVLLFEANATMLVHPEDDSGKFYYKNKAVERILSEFEKLAAGKRRATSPS